MSTGSDDDVYFDDDLDESLLHELDASAAAEEEARSTRPKTLPSTGKRAVLEREDEEQESVKQDYRADAAYGATGFGEIGEFIRSLARLRSGWRAPRGLGYSADLLHV